MLFSAELVLEEKIEYNDLVNSIQNGESSNDDEHSNDQSEKPKDAASENGNFYIVLLHTVTHAHCWQRCNMKPDEFMLFCSLHCYF